MLKVRKCRSSSQSLLFCCFRNCIMFLLLWSGYYSIKEISTGTVAAATVDNINQTTVPTKTPLLSRKKRFLAFPLGSSFSGAICLTTGVLGNPNYQFLSMGLNWGVAYELPNATWVLEHAHLIGRIRSGDGGDDDGGDSDGDSDAATDNGNGDSGDNGSTLSEADKAVPVPQPAVDVPMAKRRHRRQLYGKLETLMNNISNKNDPGNYDTGTIIECVYDADSDADSNVNAAVDISNDNNTDIVADIGDNCTGTTGAINANVMRVESNFPNENQIINTPTTSVTMPTATNATNATAVAVSQRNNNNKSSVLQTEANDLWSLPSSTTPAWFPTSLLLTKNPNHPAESSSSELIAAERKHSYPNAHQSSQTVLSRPRRYLSFPEGASFSAALCITVGVIGNPRYNYMSYGLNWGVAYDLPNTSWVLNHLHGFSRHPIPVPVYQRRERRYLYSQIERFVDRMGFNGRECVLRALCESRRIFTKSKMNMIGEMLRVIFSLPKQRLFTRELHENSDIEVYDHAYRKARSIDCLTAYDCHFSLLELAVGKYSTPPPGYYEPH